MLPLVVATAEPYKHKASSTAKQAIKNKAKGSFIIKHLTVLLYLYCTQKTLADL